MSSSENGSESTAGLVESDQHILNFLDCMDSYLILMDSLSSALRQGWLDLASARISMGASRVNSALFDLKTHNASTSVNAHEVHTDEEFPHFTLCKWASTNEFENAEAKFEEDELMHSKFPSGYQDPEHQDEKAEDCGSPITSDNQAQKERSKSLSMFGTLVSPKLRATQLSFETALEMLVEISNVRASMLHAYDQVQKDLKKNME